MAPLCVGVLAASEAAGAGMAVGATTPGAAGNPAAGAEFPAGIAGRPDPAEILGRDPLPPEPWERTRTYPRYSRKLRTKNTMVARMVNLLRTLLVSGPKVDSIMPPPMAAMPLSDLARCASTTKMRAIATRMSRKVPMPMNTGIIKGA